MEFEADFFNRIGQKQTPEYPRLYIPDTQISTTTAQNLECQFLDQNKAQPANADWITRSAQLGGSNLASRGLAATATIRIAMTPTLSVEQRRACRYFTTGSLRYSVPGNTLVLHPD